MDTQYYITLQDTVIQYGKVEKTSAKVFVDKANFLIKKYIYSFESGTGSYTNIFTFTNWNLSEKIDDSINLAFQKIRRRANSSEYLSKFPTRKMRLERNKMLSFDDLVLIDTTEARLRLGDFNENFIILYFWFEGCYHCKRVGPIIDKYYTNTKRHDITYIGIETLVQNKESLIRSVNTNKYHFPNFRYGHGVKDLTVNGAPMVYIYDNCQNKIIEQLLGGGKDYKTKFSEIIERLQLK